MLHRRFPRSPSCDRAQETPLIVHLRQYRARVAGTGYLSRRSQEVRQWGTCRRCRFFLYFWHRRTIISTAHNTNQTFGTPFLTLYSFLLLSPLKRRALRALELSSWFGGGPAAIHTSTGNQPGAKPNLRRTLYAFFQEATAVQNLQGRRVGPLVSACCAKVKFGWGGMFFCGPRNPLNLAASQLVHTTTNAHPWLRVLRTARGAPIV